MCVSVCVCVCVCVSYATLLLLLASDFVCVVIRMNGPL